ncbi:MAG: anti-sigma factor [Gemmatimonadota bacterium]
MTERRPHAERSNPPLDPLTGPGNEHAAWEDRIVAALDGRAEPESLDALERHLVACAECRSAQADYRELFARIREMPQASPAPASASQLDPGPAEQPLDPAFLDALAQGVEQRIAAAAAAGPPEDLTGSGLSVAEGGPAVAVPLHARWGAVAGGLVAAGIAVVLLVGIYLQGPRATAEPQAFTEPVSDPLVVDAGAETALLAEAGLAGVGSLQAGAASPEETWLAAVSPAEARPEPLATLADPGAALEGLTPAEVEDFVLALETEI